MYLRGKWEALEQEETSLEEERIKLSKAWQDVASKREKLDKARKKLDDQVKKDAKLQFLDDFDVVTLNVGGKSFPMEVRHLLGDGIENRR
jgi:hypothetical protein